MKQLRILLCSAGEQEVEEEEEEDAEGKLFTIPLLRLNIGFIFPKNYHASS